MSNKKEVKIDADNITVYQGEEAKDYNVRVTSLETGSPIPNLPITIAFYNADRTFEREVTTNEFGIASVPIYLSGDTWNVDTHFKGNEEYKPQLVTKVVTVQKFEQLKTKITSYNLQVSEETILAMGSGYYTVLLRDSNNNSIAFEPVTFLIESELTEDDVYFTILTDEDGRIEVPYVTHNENVVITTSYDGCARYSDAQKVDIVEFADINPKFDVEFQVNESGTQIQIKKGNGAWTDILNEPNIERFVINRMEYEDTVITGIRDGIWYYKPCAIGEYDVTIYYKGDSNYYSKTVSLTYNKTINERKNMTEWVESQDGATFSSYKKSVSSLRQGDLCHLEMGFDYHSLNNNIEVIMTPYDESYIYDLSTYEDIKENEIYSFFITAEYEKLENHYGTVYKCDLLIPKLERFMVHFITTDPFFCSEADWCIWARDTNTTAHTGASDVILTQSGFGSTDTTYQQIDIVATSTNADMHEKVNDYYSMKLRNNDTLEEFYFYGYLIDAVTPSHSDINIGLGDWEMVLISQSTDDYYGAMVKTNATITQEEVIIPSTDFFYDLGNWNLFDVDGVPSQLNIGGYIQFDSLTNGLAITNEFTNANEWNLEFRLQFGGNPIRPKDPPYEENGFFIGADPTQSPTGDGANVTIENGLVVRCKEIREYKNGQIINSKDINVKLATFKINRTGTHLELYIDDELVYETDEVFNNTVGLFSFDNTPSLSDMILYSIPIADITPSVDDYDGSVYGSDIHFEVRDGKVSLTDYGMLPNGAVSGGKVLVDDVPVTGNNLELQLEMKYNNIRFDRLNNLTGEMQMRVYEDVSTSDSAKIYEKVLCSPMVVPNVQTVFTRHSEEGILYYIKDPSTEREKITPYYLCNAYTQYKGGCELKSETGISLFNLDNAFSPVYMSNNLVRAEFHRRSGYVGLSRWDENNNGWVRVNVLKLKKNPQLNLVQYNDDYCEVQFGETNWKIYRGRPFIVVNHSKDDLRILNLVDRVYCETNENERQMGFIEERDAICGVFTPQVSIQQFKQELHIGENIKLDNFELYDATTNGNISEVDTDSIMSITNIDGENALAITKLNNGYSALNFPSYSHYVKKVGDDFSLLIGYVDSSISSITVKARGFDDKGAVPVKDGIQYGIWEQSKTVTVSTSNIDEIRVNFKCDNPNVKYLDFIVVLNTNSNAEVVFKDFMYYEGNDIDIKHQTDTSLEFADRTEVYFKETYYANLFNEDDDFGLCIVRPSQHQFSLKSIYADKETVLIPYMKKASDWDKPSQVFLEYLNAKQQIIDIDWEN